MRLDLARIRTIQSNLSPAFCASPQFECADLSGQFGCTVVLKVETLNPIRCFKGRGTEAAIDLAMRQGCRRIVCASAGNLGQAVAYCCRGRGLEATVVASQHASPPKLERIRALGAQLELVEGDIEVAREVARTIARQQGFYLIEDSENVGTCEGAATIGLELIQGQDQRPYDVVLIALGGGAMATGVGYVFKQLSPQTKVICVQPEGAPAMTLSWRSGKVVNTETMNTIADGVAGRYPIQEVLDDLLQVADDAMLVQEESIMRGMKLLHQASGLVCEPSAALGIAAILENRDRFKSLKVASIICGSNVDWEDFQRWVA